MAALTPAPGVYVLHVEGENDALAAQRVRYDLAAAVESASSLILDLTDATSLGPRMMALLVDGVAQCEERQRTCLLLLPERSAPEVRSRFERYGLTSLLPVVRSWDEALERARPPGAGPPRQH